jgi:3-oxoacyl-[acyl-carrier protein] reductase
MLVTGAASGIGRCLAGMLHQRGHTLVLADLSLPALQATAAREGWMAASVWLRPLDVRDPEAWRVLLDEIVERHGRIDVLWNVAGFLRPGYVHESSSADVATHLDTNAKGPILGSQAAAVHMVRQGSGHIVNVGSMAAIAPVSGITLYTASKFAVRGFSLALAGELRRHGVAVTIVCPDAVQTPMLDLQLDYPEAAMTFSGRRALSVEQICAVMVNQVLRDRPLEVVVPPWRGWLAKLSSAFPSLTRTLAPYLLKQGAARQQELRARRDAESSSAEVPAPR